MDSGLLKLNLYRPAYQVPPPPHPLQMSATINNNFQYFPSFIYRPGESFQAPLDLSFKANETSPDTPPSTPSPQRKRFKILDEIEADNRKVHMKTPTASATAKYFRKFSQFSDTIYVDNKKYYNSTSNDFNKNAIQYFENLKNVVPSEPCKEDGAVNVSDKGCETSEVKNTAEGLLTENIVDSSGDEDDDDFIDITGPDDDYYMMSGNKMDSSLLVDDSTSVDIETVPTAESYHKSEGTVQESAAVLEKGKGYFEDDKLHNQAIEGFAKLFEKNFGAQTETSTVENNVNSPGDIKNHSLKMERKRIKTRKQITDEDNTSPVSGTIIRELKDGEEYVIRKGDIDPAFNLVEITEESKANLKKIFNRIGSYLCKLCNSLYEDAFCLAQHRCPRIVHIEYRCSECEKIFNSPANLASHKRWHKPRQLNLNKKPADEHSNAVSNIPNAENAGDPVTDAEKPFSDVEESFPCNECGKVFRRLAYLKKHSLCHRPLSATGALPNETALMYEKPHPQLYAPHLNQPPPHQQQPFGGVVSNDYFGAIMSDYDKRKFQTFSEYYLQQQERLSAFQFVKNNPYEDYTKKIAIDFHHTLFIWTNDNKYCGQYPDWPPPCPLGIPNPPPISWL